MIIRKKLPSRPFTQIDKVVITDQSLSDGAIRLYAFLMGLKNGDNFADAYLVKAMGISQRSLTNRKRELKNAGLILVDQITPRLYVIYIGDSRKSAAECKSEWEADDASLIQEGK